MFKYLTNYNRGFTLIELLVVVLIIGVLTAITVPMYQKSVERARMAEAVSFLRTIALANERYRLATGEYTTDITQLDIELPGTGTSTAAKTTKHFSYSCNGTNLDGTNFSFISMAWRLPTAQAYYFGVRPASQNYKMWCRIYETANDIQKELCAEFNENGGSI